MERFYDPVEGTIRFLGEDVRFLGRDAVRTHLAYVEQDAPALSGTVRENLLPGSHKATDEECVEALRAGQQIRSEEHTSELQSRFDLVCRLLLEKKKKKNIISTDKKAAGRL